MFSYIREKIVKILNNKEIFSNSKYYTMSELKSKILKEFIKKVENFGVPIDEMDNKTIDEFIDYVIFEILGYIIDSAEQDDLNEVRKFIYISIHRSLDNDKISNVLTNINKKTEELKKLEKEIDELKQATDIMIKERDNLQISYINLFDIQRFIYNNTKTKYSYSTLQQWKDKGMFGEGISEDKLCPNSYTSRAYYFDKKVVVSNLIKEGKVTPKYTILDQLNDYTVVGINLNYDNTKLIYTVKDFDIDTEEQFDEDDIDYYISFRK